MASKWFSIFMLREKLIMGALRKQYKVLTVNQIFFIGDIAEKDWVNSNYEHEKKELESTK